MHGWFEVRLPFFESPVFWYLRSITSSSILAMKISENYGSAARDRSVSIHAWPGAMKSNRGLMYIVPYEQSR